MVDPKHVHDHGVVVNLVHDSVRTATRRPETSGLSLEWMPDAARGISEGAKHELDDGSGDTFWQTSQGTFCRRSYREPVIRLGHLCRYLARNCLTS
jgi:hypothetical protein